jgi:hypothetical protein
LATLTRTGYAQSAVKHSMGKQRPPTHLIVQIDVSDPDGYADDAIVIAFTNCCAMAVAS